MTYLKICGITNVEDAILATEAGADALGLNFVRSSKRVIDRATAAHISDAVGHRIELVAVVADRSAHELADLREETGIRWLQLHGSEAPEDLELVLPEAYKAIAIGSAADAQRAGEYGGDRLLVDAKSGTPGVLGGTGHTFDWSLVAALAARRDLIVAGGLTPDNVAEAVRTLEPFGVDVASGVELPGNARQKDAARVHAFVAAVRASERQR
ncbi:MAG TPA: phosphoribosylanthranilate isomerase [Polyangiaceae bacterium]